MDRQRKKYNSTAEFTLARIGGRCKIPLIFHLLTGTKRFSELVRLLPGVTQKMLTQQLREMERDGLVRRKVFAQIPPKVEYSLTELGVSLRPVVDVMCRWGETHGEPRGAREARS